jgi:hypothetical protein
VVGEEPDGAVGGGQGEKDGPLAAGRHQQDTVIVINIVRIVAIVIVMVIVMLVLSCSFGEGKNQPSGIMNLQHLHGNRPVMSNGMIF